jgi:hypothetical protein
MNPPVQHPQRPAAEVAGAVGLFATAVAWIGVSFLVWMYVGVNHMDDEAAPAGMSVTLLAMIGLSIVGAILIGAMFHWRRVGLWALAITAATWFVGLILVLDNWWM